jgi:hypothetical protein
VDFLATRRRVEDVLTETEIGDVGVAVRDACVDGAGVPVVALARAAVRGWLDPDGWSWDGGFRVVVVPGSVVSEG